MPAATLEERLVTVERELSAVGSELVRVKHQLASVIGNEPTPKPDWLKDVIGSMAEFPEFAEVVRLGREWREAQRPAADKDN